MRHTHHVRLGRRWLCFSHAYYVTYLDTEEGREFGWRREWVKA